MKIVIKKGHLISHVYMMMLESKNHYIHPHHNIRATNFIYEHMLDDIKKNYYFDMDFEFMAKR